MATDNQKQATDNQKQATDNQKQATDNQKQALDWLRDWSKWLIAINFGAATGCAIGAKSGIAGPAFFLLVAATAVFTISVICAAVLVGFTSQIVEKLRPTEPEPNAKSILDVAIGRRLSLRRLALCQLCLTSIGALLFIAWLAMLNQNQVTQTKSDLRAAVSFTESQLSEYKSMLHLLGSLTLEADIAFVNFGESTIEVSDVIAFVETVDRDHVIRWESAEYTDRYISGDSKSWGLPRLSVDPRASVKQHVDFRSIEIRNSDDRFLPDKAILVGLEFRVKGADGIESIHREPVLSIKGSSTTRSETFTRIYADQYHTAR